MLSLSLVIRQLYYYHLILEIAIQGDTVNTYLFHADTSCLTDSGELNGPVVGVSLENQLQIISNMYVHQTTFFFFLFTCLHEGQKSYFIEQLVLIGTQVRLH